MRYFSAITKLLSLVMFGMEVYVGKNFAVLEIWNAFVFGIQNGNIGNG